MISKTFKIIFFLFVVSSTTVVAQETVRYTPKDKSPAEIMRYVRQAVALVMAKGDGAYAELTDPNGPWVDGSWYLYINDYNGNIVAHLNKKLVGKNMYGVRDVKGNAFYAQLQKNARSKRGYGWTEFWWPKPDLIEPAQKVGFVMNVPGKGVWVGTGIYDMKQADIDKMLKEQAGE